jgi:hypothetical protein
MAFSWKGRDGNQYEVTKVTDQHLLRTHRLFRERHRNISTQIEETPPSTFTLAYLTRQLASLTDTIDHLTEEVNKRGLEPLELRTQEQATEERRRWEERGRELQSMQFRQRERQQEEQERLQQREREIRNQLFPPAPLELLDLNLNFNEEVAARERLLQRERDIQRMRQEVEALERRAANAERRLAQNKRNKKNKNEPEQAEILGNTTRRSKRRIILPETPQEIPDED